jgi:hypothetical protein
MSARVLCPPPAAVWVPSTSQSLPPQDAGFRLDLVCVVVAEPLTGCRRIYDREAPHRRLRPSICSFVLPACRA